MTDYLTDNVAPFMDESAGSPPVRGFLHRAAAGSGDTFVLTHGAGSNCESLLLVAMATAFASAGFTVLRCDLPFRQARRRGPPFPASAARDREGLRRAVLALRRVVSGHIFLGGHSYGGRQASILASAEPSLSDGLLLLSYPLHPPRRPFDLRTAHFAELRTRALFVHGTHDPFGSVEEITSALALIPAPTRLVIIQGGAHDLLSPRKMMSAAERWTEILAAFRELME